MEVAPHCERVKTSKQKMVVELKHEKNPLNVILKDNGTKRKLNEN